MLLQLMRKEFMTQNMIIIFSAFIWFIPFTGFFTNGSPIMHVALLIMLSVWIPLNTEYYEKPTLVNSLPVRRKQVIQAKYLTGIMWFIPAAIIVIIYVVLFENFAPFPTRLMTGEDLLLALTGVYLFLSIFYPLYFLTGFIISSVLTGAAALSMVIGIRTVINIYHNPSLTYIDDFVDTISANQTPSIIILAAVVLLITILSYMLSVRVYEKKDIFQQ